MGVRLYSPALGRFLQVDPVRGGSCNAYEYTCGDPVNKEDLDGKSIKRICRVKNWCKWIVKKTVGQAWRAFQWSHRASLNAAVRGALKVGRFVSRFKGSSWQKKRIEYKGKRVGWRIGYDNKPHKFERFGNRKHFQIDIWLPGIKKSGRSWRIPVFW